MGPWTNFPESCNSIESISILWEKDKNYYQTQIFCDSSLVNKTTNASTVPISYFAKHYKDCEFDRSYFKNHKYLPPVPTDGSWEYLILMTSSKKLFLGLSEHHRVLEPWIKFKSIQATIKAFDTIKSEMNIK